MSKSKKYKGLKKAVLNYNNFGHIGITIYFNPKTNTANRILSVGLIFFTHIHS